MERKSVIVMGRNYASRLGMIRAAGEAGCDVAVIKTERSSGKKVEKIDASSRYVRRYDCCPQPDQAGLIRLIRSLKGDKGDKPVLLPTDDYTASTVDMYLDELIGDFELPNIGRRQGEVVRAMDKMVQKQAALDAGLNVAMGWKCAVSSGNYTVPDDVVFPCFIKPEVSIRGSKYQMKKCASREELSEALKSIAARSDADILIEEHIRIDREIAVLGCCTEGGCVMPGVLETQLAHMGVTGIGRVVPMSAYPGLEQSLCGFMRTFGFSGLFDVDLFISGDKVYFNELNLRYGANGYAISHGVMNLPALFIGAEKDPAPVRPAEFEPFTFLNEKVCHQLCTDGKMTWKDFDHRLKETEMTFVKSGTDPKPYHYFRTKVFLSRIKHAIK